MPNLLCGLVCAGANKPRPDDVGKLTALEIMDLDLSGVELAVLSACETGLGEIVKGDGVLGLQRAFQLAGARTTVTSLWQIPDAATSALMIRFYENKLKRNMPALEALREAQLWVLNNGVDAGVLTEAPKNGRRTPPLYWGAFTLAGDWR
jgi:CHAT domain-containing protein